MKNAASWGGTIQEHCKYTSCSDQIQWHLRSFVHSVQLPLYRLSVFRLHSIRSTLVAQCKYMNIDQCIEYSSISSKKWILSGHLYQSIWNVIWGSCIEVVWFLWFCSWFIYAFFFNSPPIFKMMSLYFCICSFLYNPIFWGWHENTKSS